MNIINKNIESTKIKQDAFINYLFLNDENLKSESIIDVDKNINLSLLIFDFSNSNKDIDLTINLNSKSSLNIDLASISKGDKKKKFKILVNHLDKESTSKVKMIGINDDEATLIFKGDSYIKNGASLSSTLQEARITNLSSSCHSEASPGLYIKENDVKASHKAGLGSYNDKEIYYLLSRGLSLKESKVLITTGQLKPMIDRIDDSKIKDEILDKLKEVLK